MQTKGAVIMESPGKWEVVELDLDGPQRGELLVRMVASGLCHSDDHLATGDMQAHMYPMAGGHEGAGIVEEVGPDTDGWKVGDRIVTAFLPSCGRCRWCASGWQNLCDSGMHTLTGQRPDGSWRLRLDGKPIAQMSGISTFSQFSTISTLSAIRCPDDVPLESACLCGCGVGTGWGSAVNSAEVRPGDVVIVMGVGGIGVNAVQGAAHCGASVIVAVDPVELKRTTALSLGATHAVETMTEARHIVGPLTNGQGADSCIIAVGVTDGDHVAQGVDAIRKGGTCVVTGVGKTAEVGIPVSPTMLTLFQKRIQGSLFGGMSPSKDIPLLLELYRQGRLHLDELVTRTYSLDQINDGYADMHAGRNVRGVLVHEGDEEP
jgi:S-(hydroxymethyl)glutathione dehydrogenase/alcohol dehydrogenase